MTRLRGVVLTLLGLFLSSACQRKAPGPLECQRFALQVVGVSNPRALDRPNVKAAVDEVTVACLTRPFSRALLRCVEEGSNVRHCFATYAPRAKPRGEPAGTELFGPEF